MIRASLFAATVLLSASVWSQTLEVLLTNGPTASRINIVLLSEGYTQDELPKFRTNATAILNRLLQTPPFADYQSYFNAFGIFVASQESGSDHPSSAIYRDTYFNSTYDSYGLTYLITIPPNDVDPIYDNGKGKVYELLAELTPEYDVVAMVVNDTDYGGSGGEPLIASIDTFSAEIAVHELGHSYAGLGDEYSAPYPGFPEVEEPNTTTNRTQIKWASWIVDTTPVPTPATDLYANVVGLFEGAHYHATGWYRPKLDCKMRTLGQPFCEVCAERLVISTYELIRPIEVVTPATNAPYTLMDTQSLTLTAQTLEPGSPLKLQWYLNDQAIPNATNVALSLSGSALPLGTNQVRLVTTDGTSRVRRDPARLLTDTRTWALNVRATRPAIAAEYVGGALVLSWPASAESFVLESRGELSGALNWQPVPVAPTRVDDRFFLTITIAKGSAFYRLRSE
jgi:hypothetical protein